MTTIGDPNCMGERMPGPVNLDHYKRNTTISETTISEIYPVQNIGRIVGTGDFDHYKRNTTISETTISEITCRVKAAKLGQ